MIKNISLRKRLVWYVVAITIFMSIVTGIGVFIGTTAESDEIFDHYLIQNAHMLDGLINQKLIQNKRYYLQQSISEKNINVTSKYNNKFKKMFFYSIYNLDKQTVLQTKFSPHLAFETHQDGFRKITIDDDSWMTFTLKSSYDDLWIVVGEQLDVRHEINEYLATALLIPLILIFPLTLFLLWHLVGYILKPIQNAVNQVQQQDINQLKQIKVDHLPQEVEPLVQALNQMVHKLDVAYQKQKRFVSDTSHELRNPLAALLINIENALEENKDSGINESLSDMKMSIKKLIHLVSQLLSLSHSENMLSTEHFEPINLNTLCQNTINSYKRSANAKNQCITLNSIKDIEYSINGVKSLINSLIDNILDNAIKYSPVNSSIQINCTKQDKHIIFSIEDSGKGLSQDMQKTVTQRFVRANNLNIEGAGLGLSIVKTIAELHNTNLHINQSSQGGLKVSVRFKAIEFV